MMRDPKVATLGPWPQVFLEIFGKTSTNWHPFALMYSWTCVFYSAKHVWCHPTKKHGGPGSGNLGKSLWLGLGQFWTTLCILEMPWHSSRMDGFFFGFDLQNQGKCWVRNMSRVDVSLSMQQVYIYIITLLYIYIYIYYIYIHSYIDISLWIYIYIYSTYWATFIRWLLEPKYTSPDTYLVAVYLEMPTAYIPESIPNGAAATSTRGLRCCRRNTSKPPLGRG